MYEFDFDVKDDLETALDEYWMPCVHGKYPELELVVSEIKDILSEFYDHDITPSMNERFANACESFFDRTFEHGSTDTTLDLIEVLEEIYFDELDMED